MNKRLVTIMVATGLAGASAGAAPLQVQQVGGDARWVAHLDVERLWAGPFGGQLKTELATSPAKAKVDAVAMIFGLDPYKDIRGLTVYGQAPGERQGVMLVNATPLNQERILTILRAAPDYASKPYQNTTIHHWTDQRETAKDAAAGDRWGAFHGTDLIVVGNTEALLEAALDVLNGQRPALKAGDRIGGYPVDGAGAILVAAVAMSVPSPADTQSPAGADQRAMILQNVQGLSLRLVETGTTLELTALLRAKTPETAAFVEQALKGIQAFGVLSQGKKPALAQLVQAITINATGTDVKAQLVYGSQELINCFRTLKPPAQAEPEADAEMAVTVKVAPVTPTDKTAPAAPPAPVAKP
ncbi:MAG: hypothetical protein WCH61_01335 [bacterium]